MKRRCILGLFALCLLLLPVAVTAQPDSSGRNQWDVVINVGGNKQMVTVVQDALDESQWYYVPVKPRLVEEKGQPVFALTTYQFPNPNQPSNPFTGGLIQFSVNLALTPDQLTQLKSKLLGVLPAGTKDIRLTSLPFDTCEINLMNQAGELVATAPETKGITTSFANVEVPFQLNLTNMGADIFTDLVQGNTGVPVVVQYKYQAVTPPAQFKIEAEWDVVYDHVSSDFSMQAAIGDQSMGLAAAIDKKKVREFLTANKGLKLTSLEGAAWPSDKMDEVINRVLDIMYKELFEDTKIQAVDPAECKTPPNLPEAKPIPAIPDTPPAGDTASGSKGTDKPAASPIPIPLGALSKVPVSIKVGYSMKDVKKVKKGKTVIDMSKRQIVQKIGGCGSFIGVGSYITKDPSMKDKLIREVKLGNWDKATFMLSKLNQAKEMGISDVKLTVGITDGSGKQITPEGENQGVTFDPDKNAKSWVTPNGTAVDSLVFPLKSLLAKVKDAKKDLLYKIHAEITTTKNQVFKLDRTMPLLTGDLPVTTPLEFLQAVTVDGSALDFSDGNLLVANVIFTPKSGVVGRGAVTKTTKDTPLVFLVDRGDEKTPNTGTLKVTYTLKGGKKAESYLNAITDILSEGPVQVLCQEW